MKKKIVSVILCLVWMYIIFYNSSQTGTESNIFSNKLLNKMKEYLKIEETGDISSKSINMKGFYISDTIVNKKYEVSLSNVSTKTQKNIIKPSIKDIYLDFKRQLYMENSNIFLRKNAHAIEYLILAILIGAMLKSFGMSVKNLIIYVLFGVLFYAVIDEYHQIYVEGRNSKVFDILVDFIGGCIGMILFIIYHKLVSLIVGIKKKKA